MNLWSPEHKKFQEENGRKLKENLEREVKAGPKSDSLFDQLSHKFSSNLLHSINTRKVVK